jgi:hypothetical protein
MTPACGPRADRDVHQSLGTSDAQLEARNLTKCAGSSGSSNPVVSSFRDAPFAFLLPPMTSAEECRRNAAECREVAKRTSLRTERARMLQMAEHWLELARKAEAEERNRAPHPGLKSS